MKINRLIIFCLLLFVSGKSVAQVVQRGHYYFQKNKENTDKLKLYHVRNVAFVIKVDDQQPKIVHPSKMNRSFVLHNLPEGEHIIRYRTTSTRKNVDTTIYTINLSSTGKGKMHREPLHKLHGPKDQAGIVAMILTGGFIYLISQFASWRMM